MKKNKLVLLVLLIFLFLISFVSTSELFTFNQLEELAESAGFLIPSVSTSELFTFNQLKELAESVGFSPSISSTIAAIGLAESSGDPNAHNDDLSTADDSYGLMQINMINFPYYQLGNSRLREFGIESNEELFDPVVNMKAAKRIYDTSGLTAWSAYRQGTYKKYLR